MSASKRYTASQFERAFTEWERRYREDPETFMSEATRLLKMTPATYGQAVAPYFVSILDEMAGRKPLPRTRRVSTPPARKPRAR